MSEFIIGKYMTHLPATIGKDISLARAIEKMREMGVRHLPVQYAGKVVGVISDRDAQFALSVLKDAKDLKVEEVMTDEPYTVLSSCPLDEVLTEMGKQKYGCAIIENEKGRAVGIFTAVDAVRLFGAWLRESNPPAVKPVNLAY